MQRTRWLGAGAVVCGAGLADRLLGGGRRGGAGRSPRASDRRCGRPEAAATPSTIRPRPRRRPRRRRRGRLLDEDALDELVAPIALYPDALLAQVLVAATYPLDVIKADRFIDDNKDLSDKERADKAASSRTGTRASQGSPAASRPWSRTWPTRSTGPRTSATRCWRRPTTCSTRCSGMRSRAVAAGNLTSNEAQVVEARGRQHHDRAGRPERGLCAELRRDDRLYRAAGDAPARCYQGRHRLDTGNVSRPARSPSAARC